MLEKQQDWLMDTDEAEEGKMHFLEKRKPDFKSFKNSHSVS